MKIGQALFPQKCLKTVNFRQIWTSFFGHKYKTTANFSTILNSDLQLFYVHPTKKKLRESVKYFFRKSVSQKGQFWGNFGPVFWP